MTIKQARKILGVKSKSLSDKEIEARIQTATLLKDMFFGFMTKKPNKTSLKPSKVP